MLLQSSFLCCIAFLAPQHLQFFVLNPSLLEMSKTVSVFVTGYKVMPHYIKTVLRNKQTRWNWLCNLGGGGFIAKLCPTFCSPMDNSPPGSSVHGISQAGILGVGCHFRLQGIFLTQGWICVSCIGRWILYCWVSKGKPYKVPKSWKKQGSGFSPQSFQESVLLIPWF